LLASALNCTFNRSFSAFFFVYRHRPDIQTPSGNDELRSVRSQNERDRRLYRKSDDSGEYITTLTSDPTGQIRITTPPMDSNLATTMPSSSYNLQLQERERKFQDENNLLKKVN